MNGRKINLTLALRRWEKGEQQSLVNEWTQCVQGMNLKVRKMLFYKQECDVLQLMKMGICEKQEFLLEADIAALK